MLRYDTGGGGDVNTGNGRSAELKCTMFGQSKKKKNEDKPGRLSTVCRFN